MNLNDHRVSARYTVANDQDATIRHWEGARAEMMRRMREHIGSLVQDKHLRCVEVNGSASRTYEISVYVLAPADLERLVVKRAREMVREGHIQWAPDP